jgi:hypothetical protein
MRLFFLYIAYTIVSTLLLRAGVNNFSEKDFGYWSPFLITLFVHFTVVYPLGIILSAYANRKL